MFVANDFVMFLFGFVGSMDMRGLSFVSVSSCRYIRTCISRYSSMCGIVLLY
jgi:hypothetical protein